MKHKKNDPVYNPWDSQGNEKNAISISIAFCLDFLIKNANITFEKCKTKKNPFEIISHVGRVTSLQRWVAKKSCHGQTHINKCFISDYPSNYEGL